MPRYPAGARIRRWAVPRAGRSRRNGPSVQPPSEAAADAMATREACRRGRPHDAGVHALALTVHLDLAQDLPPERVMSGLKPPSPAKPDQASSRPSGPHPASTARFDAVARHYLYAASSTARAPPALGCRRVWHVRGRSMPGGCGRRPRRWSAATTSPATGTRHARPPAPSGP
jgi:tRNA U38,U39,U40 pseudouridine synthase TruA